MDLLLVSDMVVEIISSKYGEDKWGWFPKRVLRFRRPNCWGVISSMRVCPQLACIQFGVGFSVKNGDGVRFCFGDWLGKSLLRSLFPMLFRFVYSSGVMLEVGGPRG